ncbi:hypothetical protein SAMN04487912_110197 [Arthrobacter sp. cf158]|uniref:hypothetical protein n=1 Tax=Arthrobacter sp. cf158 TaxID=1761744 RepID=UPI000899F766|nr:hypothetical protein [Arthrobacter sp. cf158]SDX34708.1 hypothetical protein SAMN04487912_110197 [Arthrobacter sp. cf158]
MSTVDPIALKRLRANKRPGPISIVVSLAFQFLGGLAAGYGWPHVEAFEDIEPPLLPLVAVISSIPILVLSSIAWTAVAMKHNKLGLPLGGTLAWLGAALGVAAAAVGLGYPTALIWVGAGCLAISLLLAVLGVWAAHKRRTIAHLEATVMSTGTMTSARVSDKGYLSFSDSAKILTTVTFTFHDAGGVQRWVQRPLLITAAEPVVDGQETTLWYDPLDPGNDQKIVVKLAKDMPLRRP